MALVVFAITAFVAPGFLVGDSDSQRAAQSRADEDLTVRGVSAQDLGDKVAKALKTGQSTAVTALMCPDATDALRAFAEQFQQPQNVHIDAQGGFLGEDEKKGFASAMVSLTGSAVGRSDVDGKIPTGFTFVEQDDGWCWKDLRDMVSFLEDFRDTLNAGDLGALHSMHCMDGPPGFPSDPFEDAIALGVAWTVDNHRFTSIGGDADFVGGGATLRISFSNSRGDFCAMTVRLNT
ncbi:hypothetical protein [Saccharomonospora sp. NB11]|uniref:hypothetical protein n=1 Tax=Saccharomonospora sp. NB11 TaxID=1642298 RepID=UPI0027DD3C38|nr:hypothetical protein [Saccharomonospora sp. NB11]